MPGTAWSLFRAHFALFLELGLAFSSTDKTERQPKPADYVAQMRSMNSIASDAVYDRKLRALQKRTDAPIYGCVAKGFSFMEFTPA